MTTRPVKLQKGVSNFRYGKLIETIDPITGLSTFAVAEIKKLPTLKSVKVNRDAELTDIWYDDALRKAVSSGLMKPTIEISILDVNEEFTIEAQGYTKTNGVIRETGREIPNDLAVMFDVLMDDGSYVYHAFYKTKASLVSDEFQGMNGTAYSEQASAVSFTFMMREDNELYSGRGLSDDLDFNLRDFELEVFGISSIPAA